MRTINLDERDMSLSELLAEFARGDYILLIKNGRPIARVFGMAEATIPRKLGTMKGQIWMSDDFDAPLPDDIQAAFDGK